MRYVSVSARRQDGEPVFSGVFYSHDASEPIGQFARLLSKTANPRDRFGEATAVRLHSIVDAMVPELIWTAYVSRGG